MSFNHLHQAAATPTYQPWSAHHVASILATFSHHTLLPCIDTPSNFLYFKVMCWSWLIRSRSIAASI